MEHHAMSIPLREVTPTEEVNDENQSGKCIRGTIGRDGDPVLCQNSALLK